MIPAALCLLGLAALGAGGWLFWQARRTLRRLDAMLASAIDGGFVEEGYDESALSSLESRMARVLHGSAAANRALAEEQAAVQSLISDISHQARTPMANVLLYAALLEETGLTLADIDWFVPHQANKRIIDHVAKKLKVPNEKFYQNMMRYGNTSAASIPIALDEMAEQGLLKRGQKVLCVGFGAGLTWGGALLEW